jgi:hypothetical protein
MNETDVVEEFQSRSGAARAYREIAALLLLVSIVAFAAYGIYRSRIGTWAGAVLAAAVVLAAVTIALAVLSYVKLRCPNCGGVLGGVHDPAFCPSCGAALRTEADFGVETESAPVRRGGRNGRPAARLAAARRAAAKTWEPRSGVPGIDSYPEEAYPKNIRMFTTSDEMELTKRYIQLIDRDNSSQPALENGGRIGRLPKSAGVAFLEKPSGEEAGAGGVVQRRGTLGFLSMESVIALVAGGIILTGILIMLIYALR